MPHKTCEYCGTEFAKPSYCSKKSWLVRRFCSKQCADKEKIGKPFRNSGQFKKGENSLNNLEHRSDCRCARCVPKIGKDSPSWKGGYPILTCQICGKEFEDKTYGRKQKTCSIECRTELARRNPNSGHFKKKLSTLLMEMPRPQLMKAIRECKEYRHWRIEVYKRDQYTCQKCGYKNKKIDADHIIPFSYLIDKHLIKNIAEAVACKELWDINNGRTLCRDCHNDTKTFGASAMVFQDESDVEDIPSPAVIRYAERKRPVLTDEEKRERKLRQKRESYQRNKESYRKRKKEYYEANKERLIEQSREWAKKNADKMREYRQKYRDNNPNVDRNYYLKNRDKLIQKSADYRKNNPEKNREWQRAYKQRVRDKKARGE